MRVILTGTMRWHSRDHSLLKPAPGFVAPYLPSNAPHVPIGPGWLYEIKHDGYRLMVRKSGDRVRIYTRRGVDWTKRFPRIVSSVRKLKIECVLLDGNEPEQNSLELIAEFPRNRGGEMIRIERSETGMIYIGSWCLPVHGLSTGHYRPELFCCHESAAPQLTEALSKVAASA